MSLHSEFVERIDIDMDVGTLGQEKESGRFPSSYCDLALNRSGLVHERVAKTLPWEILVDEKALS